MPTREVPRHTWADYFDRFSRQYRGWLVSLEVIGRDSRRQVHELPLVGITAELQAARGDRIAICLGTCTNEHLTHIIPTATRVRLQKTEKGADEGVEITSAVGGTTPLRFRSAVRPEWVDGL
jgi:hypothetical protein